MPALDFDFLFPWEGAGWERERKRGMSSAFDDEVVTSFGAIVVWEGGQDFCLDVESRGGTGDFQEDDNVLEIFVVFGHVVDFESHY